MNAPIREQIYVNGAMSKAWVRYFHAINASVAGESGAVYPESFGAKGDGTTNDTAAIQAAINSLTSGGVVYFGSKTYLADALTGISNVCLRGNGTTISLRTSATNLFTATSKSNIGIDGIVFKGSNTAVSSSSTERLVYFSGCSGITVTNCEFKETIIGLQTASCTNVKVIGNHFEDILRRDDGSEGYGYLANTDNDTIVFTGNTGKNIERHFLYVSSGSSNVTITGNVATDCHGAVIACNTAGYSGQSLSRNIVIAGNTIDTVSYGSSGTDDLCGIAVTGYYSGVVIKGNSIYNIANSSAASAYGIMVQNSHLESAPITGVVISGNQVDTVDNEGIRLLNGIDVDITDNTVKNSSYAGIHISVSGTGTGSVIDHVILDRNTVNTATDYGIIIGGSDSSHEAHVAIGNNWISGAGTSDINFGSYVDAKWICPTIGFHYVYQNVAANLADFTTVMTHDAGVVDYFIMPWDGFVVQTWLSCFGTMAAGSITARMADGTGTYDGTEIVLSAGNLYVVSGAFAPVPVHAGDRIFMEINSSSDLSPTTLDLQGGITIIRNLDG